MYSSNGDFAVIWNVTTVATVLVRRGSVTGAKRMDVSEGDGQLHQGLPTSFQS